MTLSATTQSPFRPPMPLDKPESRAQAHARLLRGWMADRGLKAPALVLSVEKQGQQISADYIRKLTRAERELSSTAIELREAIRRALRVSARDWEDATGLATTADIDPDPVAHRGVPTPATLFPNLALAAEMYGKGRNADLNTPRWLNYLNNFDFADGRETDPEGWLELFQTLRRANVEPGEN